MTTLIYQTVFITYHMDPGCLLSEHPQNLHALSLLAELVCINYLLSQCLFTFCNSILIFSDRLVVVSVNIYS